MKKQIDRFSIVQSLGDSGAGAMHKAEETLAGGLTRPVTLKLLPPIAAGDKAAEARFVNEVRALSLVSGHPHVCAFYGAGVTDNTPWIATEFAPSTLASLLGELAANPADVQKLIEQVAGALAALHTAEPSLVHNDLRPANILIDAWGNFKISEFGVAGPLNVEVTLLPAMAQYAAPELLHKELGQIAPSSDLYALGHMAYQWSLGAKVYRAQFSGVFDERTSGRDAHPSRWMAWHCSTGTPATPIHEARRDFPPQLSAIIARLMSKPTAGRYASAGELLAELRQSAGAPQAAPAMPGRSAPLAGRPAPGARPAPVAPGAPTTFTRGRPTFTPRGAPAAPPAQPGGPQPAAPPPTPPAGGPTVYYLRLRDRKSGPFDFATLQRQARQGLISRLHQVSTDQVTWRAAGTVEGLFG